MQQFIHPEIEQYALNHSTKLSPVCGELAEHTVQHVPQSQMLIGPLIGSFLQTLIKSMQVKNILEIGTFTGYSALCMAEALGDDGSVTTLDVNSKTQELGMSYFKKSPHGHKIKTICRPALEVLEEFKRDNKKFQLVFIDADKQNNPNYLRECAALLDKTGMIIIDNVLYSGKVLDEKSRDAKSADGELRSAAIIHQLNSDVASSNQKYQATLLPIRDGLLLIRPL